MPGEAANLKVQLTGPAEHGLTDPSVEMLGYPIDDSMSPVESRASFSYVVATSEQNPSNIWSVSCHQSVMY